MIRTLIADDHAVVRRGVRELLSERDDLRVVGEAATGDELLKLLRKALVDVVLLDISMPGPGVFSLLKRIKAAQPGVAVLVLTMHPENQYAQRLLKAGVAGYVGKAQAPDELISAIIKVAKGGRYVSPELAETLAAQVAGNPDLMPHERLSNREFQVMCMLGSGSRVSDVAKRLWLSPKTVSTYRARILTKMQLDSNADLIRYTLEHSLEQ